MLRLACNAPRKQWLEQNAVEITRKFGFASLFGRSSFKAFSICNVSGKTNWDNRSSLRSHGFFSIPWNFRIFWFNTLRIIAQEIDWSRHLGLFLQMTSLLIWTPWHFASVSAAAKWIHREIAWDSLRKPWNLWATEVLGKQILLQKMVWPLSLYWWNHFSLVWRNNVSQGSRSIWSMRSIWCV